MPINSMDYSGKDTVLDVVRTERANFFDIVDEPKNWNVQTRCTEWEVRDIVGHMIDNVTHPYMGPLPTLFYPAFHVMDYGVHTWDMKWGLGQKDARLDERTAGVLVPYMFILMQVTVDQESVKGVDIEFGVIVDGEWGGQWRVRVKDGQYTYAPADNLDGVQAVFHFKNASDFVLTTFQRFPGGEASGDPKVIDQVRHMFFRI